MLKLLLGTPRRLGIAVAVGYVVLTQGLYLNWWYRLKSHIEVGLGAVEGDSGAMMATMATAPDLPFLLKALMFPIPTYAPYFIEGFSFRPGATFFLIAIQGVVLGGLAFFWARRRQGGNN